MGWKASTIIINRPNRVDNEIILKELGFEHLTRINDEVFGDVISPDDNKVFIGIYKNNLLICSPDIPMQFFDDSETQTEKTISRLFPNSEICSIVLHSAVNLWGYAIIKNRQKIRARAGSSDDGTFVEYGEPLEEEKELLSKSELDSNGKRIYLFDDSPDEPLTEDQVGENFVFSICKRYFDEDLDSADELIEETILMGYSYKANKIAEQGKSLEHNEVNTSSRPWWKFWQ